MKLYLMILATSVALAAASPTRNKEEPIENDLLEDLWSAEQSLHNEETAVVEKRSCVIGWKQIGQSCSRNCECCGYSAVCIGDHNPGFCGHRETANKLGQAILPVFYSYKRLKCNLLRCLELTIYSGESPHMNS
uniref:U31-Hexatoxin-Hc1j_1 n=1 Tax=Hadronyche cerberea TaxID=1107879 RepID=A0A4Q8K988_HADCE